jgi:hypothetical protein
MHQEEEQKRIWMLHFYTIEFLKQVAHYWISS